MISFFREMDISTKVNSFQTAITFVSCIITVLTVFLTAKQIKSSIKQNLFKQRVEKILLIEDIFEYYELIIQPLMRFKGTFLSFDQFSSMIDSNGISSLFSFFKPLEKLDSTRISLTFSVKANIKEIGLLWKEKHVKSILSFMKIYYSIIDTLEYYSALEYTQKHQEPTSVFPYSNSQKEKLYSLLVDLEKSYSKIKDKNTLSSLIDETKLNQK